MKYIKYASLSLLALICLPAFSMEKKRPLETKRDPLAKAPKVDDNSDENIINLVEDDEIIEEDPELAALLELEFAQQIPDEEPAHTNALQKDETTIADDESTLIDKEPQKCPVPGCKSGPQKNLKEHIKNYHHGKGAELTTCHICQKQIFRSDMNFHLFHKHEVGFRTRLEKVACDKCGKVISKQYLESHLKTLHEMSKQDYYTCKSCPTVFTGSSSIINHLKKKHQIKEKFVDHYKKETRDV